MQQQMDSCVKSMNSWSTKKRINMYESQPGQTIWIPFQRTFARDLSSSSNARNKSSQAKKYLVHEEAAVSELLVYADVEISGLAAKNAAK